MDDHIYCKHCKKRKIHKNIKIKKVDRGTYNSVIISGECIECGCKDSKIYRERND